MACRSASSATGLREATGDCWPSRAQWKESSDSCPRPGLRAIARSREFGDGALTPELRIGGVRAPSPNLPYHAMGFVDDEEIDRMRLQLFDERRVGKLLGGGEDEVRLATADPAHRLAPLALAQRAVHRGRVDAALLELVGLVLH